MKIKDGNNFQLTDQELNDFRVGDWLQLDYGPNKSKRITFEVTYHHKG